MPLKKKLLYAIILIAFLNGVVVLCAEFFFFRDGYSPIGAAIFSALLVLAVLVAFWAHLDRTVLAPLSDMTRRLSTIGSSDDLSRRLPRVGEHEIDNIALEINTLLDRLYESRHEMLKHTFRLGMSEMASEVLHNVRNSYNPLLAKLHLLLERFQGVKLERLVSLQNELRSAELTPEERQEKEQAIDELIQRLGKFVEVGQTKLDEVRTMASSIEKELESLDRFTQGARPVESLDVLKTVLDSLLYVPEELRSNLSVDLDEDLSNLPAMQGNRITILEVISNIIINSAEAFERMQSGVGRLSIRGEVEQLDGDDYVTLFIKDNGPGVAAERLPHLFERGFSSGKLRKTGLGLHWCANAVTEMNGRIKAMPSEPGAGLCMALSLLQAHE